MWIIFFVRPSIFGWSSLLLEVFYIITVTENPNVDRLIEGILSDEGQKLVEETGYPKYDNDGMRFYIEHDRIDIFY